jgi:hypothetical protein
MLAYLGLQMSLLRAERLRIWIGMGLLQFLAFAIFPYATLMMAGTTLVVTIWLLVAHLQSVPWRSLIVYGTFCAAVDFLYLRLGTITNAPPNASIGFSHRARRSATLDRRNVDHTCVLDTRNGAGP